MGNTAPTEKQENRVWVAQGKSTILCHYGLLTALMKLIRTISSSPSSCCSSTPPPRRPQYPEMYTGSNEVWGDVTMLTITDFSLDHIMLLVFATLISPSPSLRCSFIYHSLDAAIVFSRIVDSVYSVWIHNGWWFSYLVIWFGPSEGRNDKASWLWPSSRPNQMDLILMDYCTWQFLVSLCKPGPITSPPHLIFQFWRYYFPLLGTLKFLFVFLPTCCTWQPRLIDQEIRPCLLCESLWSLLLGLTVRTNWSCPWHGVVPTLFDLPPCKWARPGVSTHSLVVEQADANYKRFSCICHFLWICLKTLLLQHWQVLQGLSFYDIVCMCVIANTKSPFQILNLEMLKKPWILQRINAEMSPPQC